MTISADRYLSIDPRMVDELATGLEEGIDVAHRWGFTDEEWATLEKDEKLNRLVKEKIAENQKDGSNFRARARVMSEVLLENLFKHALDSSTQVKDKASALQILSRLGDLEPKNQVQAQGSGFSISISIPTGVVLNDNKTQDVVDAEVVPTMDSPMQISFSPQEATDGKEQETKKEVRPAISVDRDVGGVDS